MQYMAMRLPADAGGFKRLLGIVSWCAVLVSVVCIEPAPAQEKRPVAKSRPAASPARHVPRKDLLAYLEFEGLDAHANAWRASAAYKLLSDTKLGPVLEDLALQGIELIQETTPPERRVAGAEVVGLLKHIARHGFAVGVIRKGREDARFVAVLRHGDRPEFKRLLETVGAAVQHEEVDKKSDSPANGTSGHAVNWLGANGIWLAEKGDLILASAMSVDEILADERGGGSSAVDHPIRSRLLQGHAWFSARRDRVLRYDTAGAAHARCGRSRSRRPRADGIAVGFSRRGSGHTAPGSRTGTPPWNPGVARPADVWRRQAASTTAQSDESVRALDRSGEDLRPD